MDAGHIPITVEDWKGMYTRTVTDTTPQGYFLDSLNIKFNESDAYTRDGSTKLLDAPNVVRFFTYKRLGETVRYIYLNTSGQLFDSLFPGTPIWTDASFVDFSMANFNNRAYITPHNRTTGIPGKSVLVYDGYGAARLAACAAPSGFTLGAANSATSGNVEAGTHLFSVAFESNSGFITAPGPALFAVLVTPGHFSVDLSSLPGLPAGMVAVRILATKSIQTYNGNQLGYQFFFVSSANGGRVTGGASTGRVSFFDIELVTSADYLFDNRGTIPAGVVIAKYNGRMCVAGINGDEHSVYLSKPYQPEQVSSVTGFITVDPFESGSGIRNLFPFRGSLAISKSNRLYQTTDNQDDPVTWSAPIEIDIGVGAECFCVGTILDSKGQQNDRAFIADRSGLILYEGYVRRPEASWLIKNTWDRINKARFNLIQVAIDTENYQVYVTLPLDGATSITHILYGYYGSAYGPYGFDPKEINWSLWQMALGSVSIITDLDTVTGTSVLKYSGTTGHIYQVANDYSVHADDVLGFQSFIQTSLYTTKPKYTQHCNLIGLRILGLGTLITTLYDQDNVRSQVQANKTLSPTGGADLEIKPNFEGTKISVKLLTGNSINEYFKVSRKDLYLKPRWLSAPL